MKVIVVGAGIMGLSTAWALTRLGHDVTVFDQDAVPNPRGASFDQHRLIRYPYGAALGYTRMVREAYAAWDQLWADLGERHYVATGTLALCVGDTRWVEASADAMQALGSEGGMAAARGPGHAVPAPDRRRGSRPRSIRTRAACCSPTASWPRWPGTSPPEA